MTEMYFDMETIPDQREYAKHNILVNLKPPGNIKLEASIQKWREEKAPAAAEEAYQKTGLNGISGEICSIAWAIGDGEISGHIRMPSESESDLIDAFFEDVIKEVHRDGEGHFPRLNWVGHNVIDFDLRFLKQRCIVNDIKPSFVIPADAKHRNGSVFDTMKAWAGWKGFVSQDALCKALGLPQKAGMTGADVWPFYQAGRYQEILDYNKADVHTVRELFRRMSWA